MLKENFPGIDFGREVRFTMPTMFMRIFGFMSTILMVAGCAAAEKAKPGKVNFVKEIQPILEFNCVGCHREGKAKKHGGGLRLDVRELAFKGDDEGTGITPGKPGESALFELMTLPKDDELVMPPAEKEQRPTKKEIALVKRWIEEGAYWPKGLKLKPKKHTVEVEDEGKIVGAIFPKIRAAHKPVAETAMKPYQQEVPNTLVSFELVPIRGGTFKMGSPAGEKGRRPDEGPQRTVKVSPFWMGKHEVTWDEYHLFMYYDKEKATRDLIAESQEYYLAALSTPTKPYVNMDFGMGTGKHPAICMTHHAAVKYCEWLSAKTGVYYRLPTEAEWEYACRAGTTTAYSWGDAADKATISAHAWHKDNTLDPINFTPKYQKVGLKKTNPWGLYDMHGNVAEWVLDAYAPYQPVKRVLVDPWVKPVKLYPRVVRGGSYDPFMKYEDLRSAVRVSSNPDWKMQDPQLPKSIWYHTDARFVGFRIVRPLKMPTEERMREIWNIGRPPEK